LVVASGCTTTITVGTVDGPVSLDAAALVHCGAVDCEPGKICCSSACGVCAAPGECPTVLASCPDSGVVCHPDDVHLTGMPSCFSFFWDGTNCVEQAGCTCTGSECGMRRDTYVDCMELHTVCWSHFCDAVDFCPSDYFCLYTSCGTDVGLCTPVPSDCTSAAHEPTCGCDHLVYASPCEAQRARQTLEPTPGCGVCNAPATTIAPGCSTSLGWMWDGTRCVEQIGCSCAGPCDRFEPTQLACEQHYQSICRDYFTCGNTSCHRSAEYCLHDTMGGRCIPVPTSCSLPSCACVLSSQTVATRCMDDGAGGLTLAP